FDAGDKNDLKLSLAGKINAAFKTHIMIMEIAMSAGGVIKTAAGFKLDQHDGGIDLAGYHDGIVAEIEVAADLEIKDKDRSNSKNILKAKKKWKWVIADPLKANESPLRVNLIGEERPVVQPETIPGAEAVSWEMGYNPKPKLDNVPFITGFPGM
ncbi:hypothetical protein GEA64_22575, partial [Photorhabdus khanii]|nr:hypothetical protein [Photorhabdus khanii]